MNLTRCNQGHFFDADKYPTCPHCGGARPNGAPVGGGQQMPNAQVNTVPVNHMGQNQQGLTQKVDNQPAANTAPVNAQPNPAANANGGLKGQVDDVNKTVGFFRKAGGKEPVVGWLVCVEGKHFGEDFKIKMGRNFVGRSPSMDIVIANDITVSREKHAVVVFEPQESIFILLPGESKELAYLNGQVVLAPQELKIYDKIKLGETVLMFVPLCGKAFKWEEKED